MQVGSHLHVRFSYCACNSASWLIQFSSIIQVELLFLSSVCLRVWEGGEHRPPRRCPAHQLGRHFATPLCNANGSHLSKQTSYASSVKVDPPSSSRTVGDLRIPPIYAHKWHNFTYTHTL